MGWGKLIGIFALISTLVSCTSLVCKTEDLIVARVSDAVATQLKCTNVDAIEASIRQFVATFKLCKADIRKKGPVADVVCPMVSKLVATYVVQKAVPSEWGCSGVVATDKLEAVLEKVCKLVPLAEKE